MEIIGFEKDEKVLAKAEKSGGRVLWAIVYKVIALILWFAVINPLLFRWMVSQYSISYESLSDLIESVITQKAAGYVFGIMFLVLDVLFVLDAIISVILALIRHARRELYLTDRRIFGHTGNLLLGKKDFNLPLSQITRLDAGENVLTQLFRYGVVEIGTSLGEFIVDGIGNPQDFTAAYQKLWSKKSNHSLYALSAAFSLRSREVTYKTTWQCSCGKYNPVETEICSECDKTIFQSREENQRKIADEYRSIAAESGSFYRSVTGTPVLEKREHYSILAAAILYMLSGFFSVFFVIASFEAQGAALWSWLLSPIGIGVLFGTAFTVFIGIMVIMKKQWAFRVLQILMILGFVVNGLAFIGALPELSSLVYFGMVAYDVVTFLLINEGSSAMSEIVQSARRR